MSIKVEFYLNVILYPKYIYHIYHDPLSRNVLRIIAYLTTNWYTVYFDNQNGTPFGINFLLSSILHHNLSHLTRLSQWFCEETTEVDCVRLEKQTFITKHTRIKV